MKNLLHSATLALFAVALTASVYGSTPSKSVSPSVTIGDGEGGDTFLSIGDGEGGDTFLTIGDGEGGDTF